VRDGAGGSDPGRADVDVAVWLETSAEALGERIRSPGLDRAARRAGRALLRQAWAALESGQVEIELVRAVDAAACPLRAQIPRPPVIGVEMLTPGPDPDWLADLLAIEDLGAEIAGRTEKVLAMLRSPEARRLLGQTRERPDDGLDFTLTQG